ncbi:relaxase/mobilization nuclease domain-containing protein [Pseudomonas sp. HD6515]|uniref:relaxase/mobilization nuclease domain-containing protein n=1 Tax=Pseudomonas sp. HD6515 TaxID=2856556 RepID=UPI00217D7A12|nr:relaxase/mobilization nuclease domain-containing protein [Pseudomonas sp. HD6515]ELS0924341.1 relaxase/mobilization nuclease domain-containing protein [Pseudomonas putida]UWH21910.1 relaxase/mobilization nuclease domain-containing protein [Pseudomonas sp. HD6515]
MKGMDRISRGSGFAGAVKYAQFGDKGKPRDHEGIVIGGNMSSLDPRLIVQELNATKKIRPDVKRPVWHNSLRLPKGETMTREKWVSFGDRYMHKMGFSESNPRVYFLHDDKDGQHIHIIASRVGYDGKLVLGKNENLQSTKIISGLEREFGLTITKAVKYGADGRIKMPARSKISKNEIEKAVRINREPERLQLQKILNQALHSPVTATQFVESLQAAGVDVRVNIANTGRLNGFTFGLNGIYFSGSKLGKAYSCASLIKQGLSYDKNRDGEFLAQFRSEVRDDPVYSGSTSSAERHGSGWDRVTSEGVETCERSNSSAGTEYRSDPADDIANTSASSNADINNQQHRDNVPSANSLDPDSGAGPIQTGDKVSDELFRKLHNARLAEARQGAGAVEKFWAEFAAHQADQKAKQTALEAAERVQQNKLDDNDEKTINISQKLAKDGFGFATQSNITIRSEAIQNETNPSSRARRNTSEISIDAAPGRR